jgi:hypothetical protein
MPACAQAIQQQDGTYVLTLVPSNTNLSTCAYVVETGQESQIASLLSMSPQDAGQISFAIGGLWAVCWGFRLIGSMIDDGASPDS